LAAIDQLRDAVGGEGEVGDGDCDGESVGGTWEVCVVSGVVGEDGISADGGEGDREGGNAAAKDGGSEWGVSGDEGDSAGRVGTRDCGGEDELLIDVGGDGRDGEGGAGGEDLNQGSQSFEESYKGLNVGINIKNLIILQARVVIPMSVDCHLLMKDGDLVGCGGFAC
jgi:hypothetical protein